MALGPSPQPALRGGEEGVGGMDREFQGLQFQSATRFQPLRLQ